MAREDAEPVMDGADPWVGHVKGSRGYRRILIALSCAGVATFAQLYSVQGALPMISSGLHISPAQAALSVSAATIGLAVAVIPWSAIGDRTGRRKAMSVAIVAATVFGVLTPLMPNLPLLLIMRLLEGIALGGIPALALAYLVTEVHAKQSGIAAGTYVAGTTVGGLVGRLIAGPIAATLGWRWGIFVVAIIAAIAAAAFILWAPAERSFHPVSAKGPSALQRLLASLKNPALLALYAQGFLLMGGFVAMYNYLGFHLAGPPYFVPAYVTSMLFLAYLAGTFSSRFAGSLTARWGRFRMLAGSTVVMIVGLLLTLVPNLAIVIAGVAVLTAGFFAAHAISSGWAPALTTDGKSQASALYNLFYYGGSSLIGWAGGLIFQCASWTALTTFVVGLAVLAVVLTIVAFGRRSSCETR